MTIDLEASRYRVHVEILGISEIFCLAFEDSGGEDYEGYHTVAILFVKSCQKEKEKKRGRFALSSCIIGQQLDFPCVAAVSKLFRNHQDTHILESPETRARKLLNIQVFPPT